MFFIYGIALSVVDCLIYHICRSCGYCDCLGIICKTGFEDLVGVVRVFLSSLHYVLLLCLSFRKEDCGQVCQRAMMSRKSSQKYSFLRSLLEVRLQVVVVHFAKYMKFCY